MKKINLAVNDFQKMHLISDTNSKVYEYHGKMYKLIKETKFLNNTEEEKIKLADRLRLYHIEKPLELIYMGNKFKGYTSKKYMGITLKSYIDKYFDLNNDDNLNLLAFIFKDLEDIVRNVNEENIVLPDLANPNNIMITKNGLRYIDFCGLQIGNLVSSSFSSLLALSYIDLFDYQKYYMSGKFTKELDRKSLINLFFTIAFKENLSFISDFNDLYKKNIIDKIFLAHRIFDEELKRKVFLLYQDNIPNEFIANDVARLAKNYKIVNDNERILVRK